MIVLSLPRPSHDGEFSFDGGESIFQMQPEASSIEFVEVEIDDAPDEKPNHRSVEIRRSVERQKCS